MENEPRAPRMELKVGPLTYSFSPNNGWGYIHREPNYDHFMIVTEVSDEGKPVKADFLFRQVLAKEGIDIDALFEEMDDIDDEWVKEEEGLKDWEKKAFHLATQHHGIATINMTEKPYKLEISPVRKNLEPATQEHPLETEKKPVELETFELTHRLEKTVRHFGTLLLNTPDDLLYDAITTPQKSNLPFRWVSSKVIREEEE